MSASRSSLRHTIASGVVDHLTDRIMSGELLPGSHLVVESIAAELDVSPIPVREALRELAHSGLVELRPRRGAFVRAPGAGDPAVLVSLFDVRLLLDPWAAGQAAELRTDAELAAIRHAVDVGARHLRKRDIAAVGRAHFDMLQAIARACHNEFAVQALTPLHQATVLALGFTAAVTLPSGWRAHVDVVDAIDRGDRNAAEQLTRDHLLAMRSALAEMAAGGAH